MRLRGNELSPTHVHRRARPGALELSRARRARRRPGPKGVNWRPAYCAALAQVGMMTAAAEAALVTLRSVQRERLANPEFAAAEDEALEVASRMLQDEAVRRAVYGTPSFKFTKDGKPIIHPVTGVQYFEITYSDRLLVMLLQAHLPERYGNKIAVAGEITTKHVHLTWAEFHQRCEEARA